ncbi:MAG: TolC family protein [Planctomycetota bacterium]|nr:TolC family protein [Planctomycetota bacterium]
MAHDQAVKILAELQNREQIDALRSQIARARAAVAIRRANVQRAMLATKSAQSRIVTLINNPFWRNTAAVELTPAEAPATTQGTVDLHNAFQTALHYRPEVAQHMEEIREAQVRLGISKNELLPTLDLVLETYVAGLDGNYDVSDSIGSQFADGAPSYSAGIVFQVPLGNRAAQAEFRRREAQVAQLMHELNAVLARVSLEVEVAVFDVQAAYQELQGRYEAMLATDEERKYLYDRWRLLPGDERTVSFVLEELLDAQDRQMEAESSFVRSQVAYTMSHFSLQRASGALLHFGQPMHVANASEHVTVPVGGAPTYGLSP